jgi:hypothetical protein
MKKLAFVVVLVAVIVGIVFGGLSMASASVPVNPHPNPTCTPTPTPTPNCCVTMLDSINALDEKVTSIQGNVSEIASDLDSTKSDVSDIKTELDNVPKMWGYSGNFTVSYNLCSTDPYVSPSPQEPAGPKHVVMTIDFDGILNGTGHGVSVWATIGNGDPIQIWNYVGLVPSQPHFVTLDFVANDWEITGVNCDPASAFTIYYSVNVTGI